LSASTELMWGELSLANKLNPAQRHRWRLIVEEVRRSVALTQSPLVVDLGCGSGTLLSRIRTVVPGARLIGFDVERKALELAHQAVPGGEFTLADLSAADFDAGELRGKADVVLCSEVLEHLEQPEHAVRRALTLLKPGGVFVVTVPVGTITAFDRAIGHLRHYTLGAAETLLTANGFRVDRSYLWGFPFHSLFRFAVGLTGAVPSQCTDQNFGLLPTLVFRVLDRLFYFNVKSRRWGRQLVAVSVPDRAA
jgi:SAM-dependent methyltransferase